MDVQKFQYRKSLNNEPQKLLINLPTSNENYYMAKQMLMDTYGIKRMIKHAHSEARVQFAVIRQECIEQICKLLTNFVKNVMPLQALGHNVSSDKIWVYTLAKLNSETRYQWKLC